MEQEDALRKIGLGSGVLTFGMAVGIFMHYLFKVLAARFLGPDVYGVFVQALAIVESTSIVVLLGLHKSVPRFMSYQEGKGSSGVSKSVMTSLTIFVPTAIVFSFFLYFASDFISSIFSEPMLSIPLRMLSLSIVPIGLLYLVTSFFRGKKSAKDKVLIGDVIQPSLMFSCGFMLFLLGFQIEAAVGAILVGAWGASTIGLYRFISKYEVSLCAGDLMPRKLLVFSWPLFFVSVFGMFNQWYGVMTVGFFMSSSASAIYEIALSVASTLGIFLGSISYMFLPVVSDLYARKKLDQIKNIYSTSTRWILTFLLPFFAIMVIFSKEVIVVMFGSQYAGGATILTIMAAGFFSEVAIGPGRMVLLSTGQTKQYMISAGSKFILGFLLCLAVVPHYGLKGAAIATLTGTVVGNLFVLIFVRKQLGTLPYNKKYIGSFISIFMSSTIILCLRNILPNSLIASIFLAPTLVVFYVISLYFVGGIYEEEYALSMELFKYCLELVRSFF